MKKIITLALTAVFIMSIGSTSAFAMGKGQGGNSKDRDGIPNYLGTTDGINFEDNNSDGVCDNLGTNTGANFEDSNSDGVCDNLEADITNNQGRGQGQGQTQGQGKGKNR